MSPVQLLLRPFHGSKLFVFFGSLEFFATLAQKRPKTHGKTKNTKNHKVSPHVTCPASPQTLSMGRNCLFVFLFFWFSLGFCNCVSPTISIPIFLCFFVFVFLGLLGEIFTLTNIHWHSFHPSTFYIEFFIELLILATEPSEKMYSKNSFITHLFRHSIGLMFYWYAEVLVPHI